jgi:hypothetical protein
VVDMLAGLGVAPRCLQITKAGQPAHPLYMPGHLTPIPYRPVVA